MATVRIIEVVSLDHRTPLGEHFNELSVAYEWACQVFRDESGAQTVDGGSEYRNC